MNKDKVNILVVVRNLNKGGGLSEWVINTYNQLSKEKNMKISILVEEVSNLDDFNISNDIEIIQGISIKHSFKYIKYWRTIKKKFLNMEYDYVHFHVDNFVRFFNVLLLRKLPNVIIHSHSSYNEQVQNNIIKKALHNIGKIIVKRGRYYYFACSELAAQWLFDDLNYIQINNGIDLKQFLFNEIYREKYQTELDLKGKTVYGHIGRYSFQKNHERVIHIFSEICDIDSNSVLILIGQGELVGQVKELVVQLGLENNVLFLGLRTDIDKIINAFDKIIFPSRFEGFPLVLVEAQANGIPVYFSDTITNNAKLLEESKIFSLDDSNQSIAKKIISGEILENRKEGNIILKGKKYDRLDTVKNLQEFYEQNN